MFLLLSEGLRASSSLGACPNCGISDPVLTQCSRLGGMEPSCLGFSSPPADRHTPRFRGSALGTGEAAALQDETTDVALSAQEGDVDPGAPQSPAWAASAFLERGGPPLLSHSSRLSPGTGVTVNALHPGVARTELGRHTGMHNSAFSSFTLGKSPPGLGSLCCTPALSAGGPSLCRIIPFPETQNQRVSPFRDFSGDWLTPLWRPRGLAVRSASQSFGEGGGVLPAQPQRPEGGPGGAPLSKGRRAGPAQGERELAPSSFPSSQPPGGGGVGCPWPVDSNAARLCSHTLADTPEIVLDLLSHHP